MLLQTHKLKSYALLAAVAASTFIASPLPAADQQPQPHEIKTWPAQGAWRTTLVQRPTGEHMCMLNRTGNEPHAFGVSIIEMPGHLMFAVDDRASKQGYLPTMALQIDDNPVQTFATFNDPPMTSTAPNEARRVRVLINHLSKGENLMIEARRAQYKLSLDGFRAAAAQLRACRLEVATMSSSTVGRGN